MSLSTAEFQVLRQTIATRGTVRMVLVPVTFLGWAMVSCALLLLSAVPVGVVFALAILVAGHEAVHALHVGVERIGRYLQVYYDARNDGPRWETTVMALGPALPGGGVDPLFAVLFVSATVANLIPAIMAEPTPLDLGALALLHALFIVRIVRARGAAARQRAVELESFRALKSRDDEVAQTPGDHAHTSN